MLQVAYVSLHPLDISVSVDRIETISKKAGVIDLT